MIELQQKAKTDIPQLRVFTNRLLSVVETKLGRVADPGEDNFGFMALCFLGKQAEHARSILGLGESRDVQLIARSALEGLCYLRWAAQQPDKRALRWRAFAYIHDWRLMRKQNQQGIAVDLKHIRNTEEGIRQYGPLFQKKPTKKPKNQGPNLADDPFDYSWTRCSIRQVFHDIQEFKLYSELYGPFSEWMHSNAGGIGAAISRSNSEIYYSSTSPAEAATALAVINQCLIQTVDIIDKHLQINIGSEITEITQDYVSWHQKNIP